jgi:hypothetical protein
MSNYIRVIPRDLFNEASLLKCLGTLYIALENVPDCDQAEFAVGDVDSFDIHQDSNDGSIYVANLPFVVAGRACHLSRPLNSRQPWPLWLSDRDNDDFDRIEVFNEQGKLSSDMLAFLKGVHQ